MRYFEKISFELPGLKIPKMPNITTGMNKSLINTMGSAEKQIVKMPAPQLGNVIKNV